jgi:CRISPR-associated exonuclease Cas4
VNNFDVDELSNQDILFFTGTQINYYFVCIRKLWLFSHHIELEKESDLVKLGKELHVDRYQRRLKEMQIDKIKLDFIEKGNEIHEIKRSKKMENAHLYQLLYYIYFVMKK